MQLLHYDHYHINIIIIMIIIMILVTIKDTYETLKIVKQMNHTELN